MADAPKRWFDRIRGRAPVDEAPPAVRVRVSVEAFDPAAQSLADLEQGLLFVPALAPPRVGHRLALDLEFEQGPPQRFEALVIWAKPPRAGSAGGFGARIEGPPPALLDALKDVARRWREKPPEPTDLTTLAHGLREHTRDSTPPPVSASPNIRSDPSKRSKPSPPRPRPPPLKARIPESPAPRPVARVTVVGSDIEEAAAALARQLEEGLPVPTRTVPPHVGRPRDDHATGIVVDDTLGDDEGEEEVLLPTPTPVPPAPADVLLEETDITLGAEPAAGSEPRIAVPDAGDDSVQTDLALREAGAIELTGDQENEADSSVPSRPAPVLLPRERVSFAFDDDRIDVSVDDADDAARTTLPRRLRTTAFETQGAGAELEAPAETTADEPLPEPPPHDPADDEFQFPNEHDLALHAALDVLLTAPSTPPPARATRAISLVQPPDGSLRVDVRFATPQLFVAYWGRYLADGVVYVPTTLPPRPGTALHVRMALPDGGVVSTRALVVVKPDGAPRTGCVARLVDPDDRLSERLAALARALTPT